MLKSEASTASTLSDGTHTQLGNKAGAPMRLMAGPLIVVAVVLAVVGRIVSKVFDDSHYGSSNIYQSLLS